MNINDIIYVLLGVIIALLSVYVSNVSRKPTTVNEIDIRKIKDNSGTIDNILKPSEKLQPVPPKRNIFKKVFGKDK